MATPTIGLFLGSTDNVYESQLLRGALEVAQDAAARLVVFNSGTIRSYHGYESMRNVLYSLVHEAELDALIFSGALSHHVSPQELASFCDSFGAIPLVVLGAEVPGRPAVLSDNRSGMEALLDHLLDRHAYRKIAFIGGPAGQLEAEVRKDSFLAKLRDRGEVPDPRWLVHGDYTPQSGFDAVEALLADGPLRIEGIVCANDAMATGAHRALTLRGYHVPRDLFLTGFDDDEESRFHTPPLTSVAQSPFELARVATRTALRLLRGGVPGPRQEVLSKLVVRGSCGCRSWESKTDTAFVPVDEEISDDFWQVRWLDSFGQALKTGDEATFLAEVDSLIDLHVSEIHDPLLESSIGLLRRELVNARPDPSTLLLGERLLQAASRMISERTIRVEILARLQSEAIATRILAFGEALATTFTQARVLEVIGDSLPGMGFKGLWLSLFQDPEVPDAGLSLQLACDPQRDARVVPGDVGFPSRQLVPGGLRSLDPRHSLLVIEALYSQNQRLGIIVFSTVLEGVKISGSLRTQIGGAIQGAHLLEERKSVERSMVQNEKMAALGNLVAGVAHEINTPLGVAVSGASYLLTLARKFQVGLDSGQVRKSELEALVAGTLEAGELIGSNLERAAALVASFKQVASDQASEIRRSFGLKEYLEATLVSLRPQWKTRPLSIEVRGEANLVLDSYPGAIAQVLTNLLVNALTHAFPPQKEGLIWLILEERGDRVVFRFADNGVGIPADHLPRIFEPFFTTRRGLGGTGLGLHIVLNLVEQVLGGTISCASEPGHGTVFTMVLPRSAPLKATDP